MSVTMAKEQVKEEQKFLRFPIIYRIEHWIFMLSFSTLGLTGLIQKYAGSSISIAIIKGLGGIEKTRLIHRTAATIMMIEVVYHIGVVIYRVYVRRERPSMLPTWYDMKSAWQTLLYNIGVGKVKPQQGRYTFEEKLEYWAVVWGTVVMVFTGFMMWNPIATTNLLPGEFIPAAKAAHGGEALLAVLAIILWHFYHVLVRNFNKSMFTGYVSEKTMEEDHPIELADIKAGVAQRPVSLKGIQERKRIFFPIYGLVGALLLFGIFEFVTFENTALATRPPAETVPVFVPLTPTPLPTLAPTPTSAPTAAGAAQPTTWEGGIGAIFEQKCTSCHGSGTQMSGLNLSTYQSAITGGASGPGIVPGDPSSSMIIKKQTAGGHPGQLSPEELDIIQKWIEAGAPEK